MKKSQAIITFKAKMSEALAKYIKNKPFVSLSLPKDYALGCKLYMVEYNGAPTGRADVCTIEAYDGDLTVLSRRWNWHSGKMDDDLSQLGLIICNPDNIPFYTAKNIPNV